MPIEHETLTYQSAARYLPQTMRADFYAEVLALIESSDFWQNAARYVGPLPAPGDVAGWQLLRKSFAPILKLRECLERHVGGVIGREPQFESVAESKALNVEADAVTGAIWYERGEHKLARAIAKRLLATGKVYLRYDVPPGLIVEGTDRETGELTIGVAASTWADAYELTHVELCARGSAFVYVDPSTLRKTSFYSYVEEETNQKVKCIQISWIDENKMTQIRVVRSSGAPTNWEIDTGGNLLILEADLEPMITPDLLRLQDIVCSIATMLKINADVAGYPQSEMIDIARPVERVPAPTEADPNAVKLVPAAIATGPRTRQAWYSQMATDKDGKVMTGDDGKPILRSGSIHYRDPVSSQPLRDDIEFLNTEIYSACNQRHISARTSANASAEMLIEARADYADSLLETKPDLERLLQTMFKARLCMAAHLAGDSATLEQFKAGYYRVALQLNTGPISVADATEIRARRTDGLLSTETAMILLGIENPDAELDKIAEQNKTALVTPEVPN